LPRLNKTHVKSYSIAQLKTQVYDAFRSEVQNGQRHTASPAPQMRGPQDGLGFFVRVGRNDHKEILELIAAVNAASSDS